MTRVPCFSRLFTPPSQELHEEIDTRTYDQYFEEPDSAAATLSRGSTRMSHAAEEHAAEKSACKTTRQSLEKRASAECAARCRLASGRLLAPRSAHSRARWCRSRRSRPGWRAWGRKSTTAAAPHRTTASGPRPCIGFQHHRQAEEQYCRKGQCNTQILPLHSSLTS